jgi:hypothetical protein
MRRDTIFLISMFTPVRGSKTFIKAGVFGRASTAGDATGAGG